LADVEPNPRIIELNKEFEEEMAKWEEIQIDPTSVINFNPFRIDTWVQGLTLFLKEKGIIDEDEFVIFLKEKQIKTLQEMREELTKKMRAARLQSMGVDLPTMAVPKTNVRKPGNGAA